MDIILIILNFSTKISSPQYYIYLMIKTIQSNKFLNFLIFLTACQISYQQNVLNKTSQTSNTRYDLVFFLQNVNPTNNSTTSNQNFYTPINKLRQDLLRNLSSVSANQSNENIMPIQNQNNSKFTSSSSPNLKNITNYSVLSQLPSSTIKLITIQSIIKQNSTTLASSNLRSVRQAVVQAAISQTSSSMNLMPFNKLFQRIAKPEQFQRILSEADILPLVKSIQQILGSDSICEQKTSRLSDYFGRIQSSILIKNYQNKIIRANLSDVDKQIKQLQRRLDQISTNLNSLQYQQVRDRYIFNAKLLLTSYTIKNQVIREQNLKKTQLQNINSNITQFKQMQSQNNQRLIIMKVQLTEVNYNISKLYQNQLYPLKNKLQEDQSKLYQQGLKYNGTITQLQKNKTIVEEQLRKLQKDSDERTIENNRLELDVEKVKVQLGEIKKKVQSYKIQLSNIRQRISILQNKIDLTKLQSNQVIITDLSKITPNIQQRIDEQNFKCNLIKRPEPTIYVNQISYVVSPKDFATYIKSSYNAIINIYSLPPIRTQIYPNTIQGSNWSEKYGLPYNDDSFNKAVNFYYQQDFMCLDVSQLLTGFGIITAINRKSLIIQNSGSKIKLNMAACTRVQSLEKLPIIGQQLYFRGYKIQQIQYNVYKITCF